MPFDQPLLHLCSLYNGRLGCQGFFPGGLGRQRATGINTGIQPVDALQDGIHQLDGRNLFLFHGTGHLQHRHVANSSIIHINRSGPQQWVTGYYTCNSQSRYSFGMVIVYNKEQKAHMDFEHIVYERKAGSSV